MSIEEVGDRRDRIELKLLIAIKLKLHHTVLKLGIPFALKI